MPLPREQLSIRLPGELVASIDQRASQRDCNRTAVIEDALRQEFGFGENGASEQNPDYVEVKEMLVDFDARLRIIEDLARTASG